MQPTSIPWPVRSMPIPAAGVAGHRCTGHCWTDRQPRSQCDAGQEEEKEKALSDVRDLPDVAASTRYLPGSLLLHLQRHIADTGMPLRASCDNHQ